MHKSVLINETLEYLICEKRRVVLDCTIGGGGHAKEILNRLPPGGRLIGIDADKKAIAVSEKNLKGFEGRYILEHDNFRNFDKVLKKLNIDSIDAMLFDLGISTFHLEDETRGFSFLRPGPLDMRMDITTGLPLWKILAGISEDELGRVIREFGEERFWRRIAKAIIRERQKSPIEDSMRLADIIRSAARYRRGGRIDPATRTFQALRIFVNGELTALKEVLDKVEDYLAEGGRIAIISFHSLEDRIVKHRFRELAKLGILSIMTKRPTIASEEEIKSNPRSRSAKLRVAQKM